MNTFKGELSIKLEKKTYKVLLTINSLRLLCQAEKIRLDEFDKFMQEDPLTAMCSMAYWGAKNASIRKKQDLPNFDLWCAMCLEDMETFEALSQDILATLAPEDEEGSESEGNE